MIVFAGALVACNPGGTDKGNDSDEQDTGINGTITAARAGEEATVVSPSAWGLVLNGTAAIYVSPNPDATCDDVATLLGGPGEDWDPSAVNKAGSCAIFVRASYDGEKTDYVDDPVAALVNVDCAMDTGEWVQDDHDGNVGYYYSGPWWQGSPTSFDVTIDGGEGDLSLTVEMSDYAGSFIYDEMEAAPASGHVTGQTDVGWCEALGPTGLFGG
jgi:hypothetical protein